MTKEKGRSEEMSVIPSGISVQEIYTTTTRVSDFSKELHNVLNEQFNPDRPNAVWFVFT